MAPLLSGSGCGLCPFCDGLLRYLVTVTAGRVSRIKHSRLIEQSFYTPVRRLNEANWTPQAGSDKTVAKIIKTKNYFLNGLIDRTVILLMVFCDLKIMIKISSIIQQIIIPSSYINFHRENSPKNEVFRSHFISKVSEGATELFVFLLLNLEIFSG